MDWSPQLTALRNTLAGLFSGLEDTRSLIEESGIPLVQVALGDRPITNWHEVIRQAAQRGRLDALVGSALARFPDHPVLKNFGSDLADPEPPFVWHAGPAITPTLEKITGLRSTILPVHFLEQGLVAARSVARVLLPSHVGSGFLIAADVLVTNHHVVPDIGAARTAKIQFNYEKLATGADAIVDEFGLEPDEVFVTSKDEDWTAVRVKPVDGRRASERWGALTLVDAPLHVNDPVNIIQHPSGGPKQIALYHNYVAFADQRFVQYLTDTLPGSSGSPVFNDRWEVVAVHHRGGLLEEPGTKSSFLRNQGIRSGVVLQGLKKHGVVPHA